MIFIVNYRAAIIGSVIKRLVERPGKTACCSIVLNLCSLKHLYLLQVRLSGRCRVSSTPAGALQRGHCIQRHHGASTVPPVPHLILAAGNENANLAFVNHPGHRPSHQPSCRCHASHAISATRATIQTAANRLWRAAALQKYSSRFMSCSG